MAFGWRLEAEYESGFVLREGPDDLSPYDAEKNIYNAIWRSRPSDFGHGLMVRYSLVGDELTYSIDWKPMWDLPDVFPVYERRMRNELYEDGTSSGPICELHRFGYRYDLEEETVEEIYEIEG